MDADTSSLGQRLVAAGGLYSARYAIYDDKYSATYADVFLRAGGFAYSVDAHCPNQGTVAICLAPSTDLYAAILGCILAGRTFCCLSTSDPASRRSMVLRLLGPSLALIDSEQPPVECPVVYAGNVAGRVFAPRRAAEILYVMFTSGSTGEPKGVRIAGSAVSAFLDWALSFYRPIQTDRWSQFNAPTFDLSLVDLLVTLLSGAALVPFHSEAERLRPSRKVARLGVSVWHAVPSTIRLLLEAGRQKPGALSSVRLFSFCGEPLRTRAVEELWQVAPSARVVNTYGPTEGTLFCTAYEVQKSDLTSGEATIPIGQPIDGWAIHTLPAGGPDCDLQEILIHGNHIGRGYLDGSSGGYEGPQERPTSFRTGDLVRRRGDALYFHSRNDRQRKVRGARIELGEVEAAAFDAGLGHAVAEVKAGRLVMFVSMEESCTTDDGEMRRVLSRYLPSSALPNQIVVVNAFPTTSSSKVDVAKLLTSVED